MAQSRAFANGKHDLRRGVDFTGISCSFVCYDDKGRVLLHKRSKNCRDEQGKWDNGGGAHEFGASLEDTVKREIKEEYGADAQKITFIKVHDLHRELDDGTPTHWLGILYAVRVDPKQAKNNEPHKIDDIGWFAPDDLPSPKHSQLLGNLEAVKATGIIK